MAPTAKVANSHLRPERTPHEVRDALRKVAIFLIMWLVCVVSVSALLFGQECFSQVSSSLRQQPQESRRLPFDSLTAGEKQAAERIARREPRVQAMLGGRCRLVHVDFVTPKPREESNAKKVPGGQAVPLGRNAEVVFYCYDADFGVLSIVDLEKSEAIEVRRLPGKVVPLSEEELMEARTLAFQSKEIRLFLAEPLNDTTWKGSRLCPPQRRTCAGNTAAWNFSSAEEKAI